MKRIISIAIILILAGLMFFMFNGCTTDNSADKQLASQTESMMEEANRQLGMPNITKFTQKRTLKMIYELCDKENLLCYAYIKSDYTGRLMYMGRCAGYGIPFSAQYSNPETYKIMTPANLTGKSSWGYMKMPQPEPNGLFMPQSSSATWLMMFDENNKTRVVYLEPEIVVSPFQLPCINPEDYPKKKKAVVKIE